MVVSKACDACRVRRTKCDGHQPCLKCKTSDIGCTFELSRKKRGPRGKTVTMLQEVFGSGAATTSSSATTQVCEAGPSELPTANAEISPISMIASDWLPTLDLGDNSLQLVTHASPLSLAPLALPPALLNPSPDHPFGQAFHSRAHIIELMEARVSSLLHSYFTHLHTVWPVVDGVGVLKRFGHKEHLYSESFAAMVLSMCSLALFLPFEAAKPGSSRQADTLVREALALHSSNPELGIRPNLDCISTSLIMSSALRLTHGFNAWYLRRREAYALVELLNLSNPRVYDTFTEAEKSTAVRLFWHLATGDRSNALILPKLEGDLPNFRPLIAIRGKVTHLSSIMSAEWATSAAVAQIEPTTRVFEILDEDLVACISGTCGGEGSEPCTFDAEAAMGYHRTLDAVTSGHLSPVQAADFLLTRLWLHAEIWRACTSHSVLQFEPEHRELRIEYPVEVLARTVRVINGLPASAVSGNGPAMGQKLKNIVAAAQAVLALPNPPTAFEGVASHDEAMEFVARVLELAAPLTTQRWIRFE
ncbi:Maltose fermentation regulatory protein MAL63 [Vanrija pseudolonga]|uniref:Maltose fermentation regulatory protein MAL63 n=1 Tax=Vanrija pseudolonga TaxID=143232 RepID=A0AAF0YA62_9TREE|nr:Maltose fermentation regulatory protein MAL63 [Vanrija pseudolonga]